jgi:hypothetical protein
VVVEVTVVVFGQQSPGLLGGVSPWIPPFSIAAGDVDAAAEDGEEGEVVAEAGAIIP